MAETQMPSITFAVGANSDYLERFCNPWLGL